MCASLMLRQRSRSDSHTGVAAAAAVGDFIIFSLASSMGGKDGSIYGLYWQGRAAAHHTRHCALSTRARTRVL